MSHITFIEPTGALVRVDHFTWRNKLVSETFEHTKVLWKGEHILTIKQHVDYTFKEEPSSVLDDDEDEDDTPPARLTPKIKWLIHTNWDWLKHYYGEFDTLDRAKAEATSAVTEIATNIRKAFMLRNPKSNS